MQVSSGPCPSPSMGLLSEIYCVSETPLMCQSLEIIWEKDTVSHESSQK